MTLFGVFRASRRFRTSRSVPAEKQRKSTKIDPPEGPKWTRDRPKSPLGALFERFRATKSVEDAPSSDLLSTESIENRPKSGQRAPKSAKRVKEVQLKVGSGGMRRPVGRTPGGV